jgi:hypothetical protein
MPQSRRSIGEIVDDVISSSSDRNRPPRDPLRIHVVLTELEQLWTVYPDLRLGQLLANLTAPGEDKYQIEDEVWLRRMKLVLETGSFEAARETD